MTFQNPKEPDNRRSHKHMAEADRNRDPSLLQHDHEHLVQASDDIAESVAAMIYGACDMEAFYPGLVAEMTSQHTSKAAAHSLDELLERDKMREQDGFPRKIKLSKLFRPGRGGKSKIVVVPTATEEKLYHDTRPPKKDDDSDGGGGEAGGVGDAEEGEVIGEQPIHEPGQDGNGMGPGQGSGGDHEVGGDAYELGRVITEKFQLPNLKAKGKKRSLTRYNYDLTDRNQGEGQILDKKATIKEIIKTNIALGRIDGNKPIEPDKLLVHPRDMMYRVLSKELDYDSQAIVFFVRDYSGSMYGPPTELVVSQHVIIYSCLVFQYESRVETRYIVHDTDAKELPDFYTYSHSTVAGGTKVASAMRLVNKIVDEENLAADYNIYVFYGGDGDDWDSEGRDCVNELRHMLGYANRVGFTVARQSSAPSALERYLKNSGLLEQKPELVRMVTLNPNTDEETIIESIRELIAPK